MARIRSVHPGLFTDESFVSLSCDAQILLIGIWTEADDQGVFEWKPLTLRMRLRPTKDGPIDPLLSEIESVNCIKQFEADGRRYGAIRNFRKYQKPKYPNAVHPTTDEIRKYVGLTESIPEIGDDEPKPLPPKEEKSFQMEDGGDNREGNIPPIAPPSSDGEPDDDFLGFWAAYPRKVSKGQAIKAYRTARKKADAEVILAGLANAKAAWVAKGTEIEFIPHAATWLNGERWADESTASSGVLVDSDGNVREGTDWDAFYARLGPIS